MRTMKMTKCELTRDELRELFLDNIAIGYELIRDEFLKKTPEQLWDECFAMSFNRGFYMFLVYKAQTATKGELKYLQKKNVLSELINDYYEGDYQSDYIGYGQLVKDYVDKQKKMEQTGDME